MSRAFRLPIAILTLTLVSGVASASPLLVNGGFETGNFSGWNVTGGPCEFVLKDIASQSTCTGVDPGTDPGPRDGTYAAYLGQAGSLGSISQTIATTVGTSYDVQFYLANTSLGGDTNPNEFQVLWNGAPILTEIDLPVSGYQEYNILETATGTSATLEFAAQQNPAYFVLDDVSVTDPPAPVPEPATLALFAGGLAVLRMRRGRTPAPASPVLDPSPV
jgi:hypothetical protein